MARRRKMLVNIDRTIGLKRVHEYVSEGECFNEARQGRNYKLNILCMYKKLEIKLIK